MKVGSTSTVYVLQDFYIGRWEDRFAHANKRLVEQIYDEYRTQHLRPWRILERQQQVLALDTKEIPPANLTDVNERELNWA